MAEPIHQHGLADTREGRLTIIVVVGGTLLVALSFLDVWMSNTADDEADAIRTTLRRELAVVPDPTLASYPETADELAERARAALADDGLPGRVARVERPDRDEVVVAVESGLAWHPRCIEAELRGDHTVLTHRRSRPC
jgi:hypothetical protein